MVKQIFNVIVNPLNCTLESSINDNSDKSYFIDWSARMPQGKYRLSFTFISEGNKVQTLTSIPVVYCDLASSSNSIYPQSAVYPNTNVLGTLFPTLMDSNAHISCFRADLNSNPPIYLSNRPYNNLFNVQILNNNVPPLEYLDESTIPANIGMYMLTLHFELLELQ